MLPSHLGRVSCRRDTSALRRRTLHTHKVTEHWATDDTGDTTRDTTCSRKNNFSSIIFIA